MSIIGPLMQIALVVFLARLAFEPQRVYGGAGARGNQPSAFSGNLRALLEAPRPKATLPLGRARRQAFWRLIG